MCLPLFNHWISRQLPPEVMYKLFAMLEMKYDFKLSNGRRNGGNEMRKRILSLLLCCVMLIGLLPTAAFAEDSAEEPPVCSCETACTAESMNADCPVCSAEGADPENCKCATVESEQKVAPISTSSFPTENLVDPVIRIQLSSDGGYYSVLNGTWTAADFFQPGAYYQDPERLRQRRLRGSE